MEIIPQQKDPEISIVVPVYNSEDCLSELTNRVSSELASRSYEIILVNDGSADNSWKTILSLAAEDAAVRGINLRRNFGQDNALMAGMAHACGEVIVIMDDDLQHDPADIAALVDKVKAGFDVCYARFEEKRQAVWKNAGSRINDWMANLALHKPRDIYLSPFKAISREVVAEILNYGGPYPYVDGLLFRVTTNITQIDVPHHPRYAGSSNYNLFRSIAVWLKLATSFSLVPLRIATYIGFTLALSGLGFAAYFASKKLFAPEMPIGWASSIVTSLVLGGVQLGCLGIIGEYLGRIFIHLNVQPQYVIRNFTGQKKPTSEHKGHTEPTL